MMMMMMMTLCQLEATGAENISAALITATVRRSALAASVDAAFDFIQTAKTASV